MKETKLFIITGLAIIVFILFPYFYLNTNAFLIIHDNLDGEFVYSHLLKTTNLLFSFNGNTIVPNVMNGIPRSSFHSEFSFIRLLFYLFPSFWAYIINSVLVRIIGFAGMYLLAKDYLIKRSNIKIIIFFAALFSIIPVFTLYGLSVMGQPILMWAFLNLSYGRKKYVNWLIILFFPFYVHFALIAPFILFAIGAYGLFELFSKNKKIKKYYFIGLGFLFFCFIIANFVTLKNFLFPGDYIAHRTEMITQPYSLRSAIKRFIYTFTSGNDNSSSFIAIPIYLFATLILFSVRKVRKKMIFIAIPIVLIGAISLFDSIYPFITYSLENTFHILRSFQFNRFTFLIPMLWFIILGITLSYSINRIRPTILYSFLILQTLFIIWPNKELKYNYAKIILNKNHTENIPSFKSFYASNLFSNISKFINKPKKDYRVVSLGIHPSIAQYNGFYTLDSYQNNYPLKYKHEFREIIDKELNKNEDIRIYFDDWGNRCYLFSSELKNSCYVNCLKNSNIRVDNLEINTAALMKMGGEYILSAVPITNYDDIHLKFLNKFSDKEAMWDIYLYKL